MGDYSNEVVSDGVSPLVNLCVRACVWLFVPSACLLHWPFIIYLIVLKKIHVKKSFWNIVRLNNPLNQFDPLRLSIREQKLTTIHTLSSNNPIIIIQNLNFNIVSLNATSKQCEIFLRHGLKYLTILLRIF